MQVQSFARRGRRREIVHALAVLALLVAALAVGSSVADAARRTGPSAPRSVQAQGLHRSIEVSWSAPSETGTAPIRGYRVEARARGGKWSTARTTAADDLRASITRVNGKRLVNGGRYEVRVVAVTSAGKRASQVVVVRPAPVPAAPRQVAATAGDRRLTVTWQPPSRTNGSTVRRYVVQTLTSRGVWRTVATVGGARRSATVTGLANGTSVTVRVAARNRAGVGAWRAAAPVALPTVLQVSSGDRHACALLPSRQVACWGYNAAGQLGVGDIDGRLTPTAVLAVGGSPLEGVVAVDAGENHTCAVLADTTVWCWGLDSDGQVSPGATSDPAFATAVTTDGSTPLTGVVEVSTGGRHTCARLRTGQVRCWGFNGTGQLGDGSVVTPANPVSVLTDAVTSLTGVVELAAGGNHTCARLAAGTVMCWGRGSEGQLGAGGAPLYEVYPNLVLVDGGGSIAGATAISAGYNHNCVVWGDDARASCWGVNFFGQLGNGSTATATSAVTFTAVSGAPVLGAVDVAAGLNHTCVVMQSGTMGCAGSAAFGQLGAGSVPSGQSERGVAVALAAGVRAAAVTAEGDQSCIVDRTGRPWCWGRNATGGVGDGSTDQRDAPVRPVGL